VDKNKSSSDKVSMGYTHSAERKVRGRGPAIGKETTSAPKATIRLLSPTELFQDHGRISRACGERRGVQTCASNGKTGKKTWGIDNMLSYKGRSRGTPCKLSGNRGGGPSLHTGRGCSRKAVRVGRENRCIGKGVRRLRGSGLKKQEG